MKTVSGATAIVQDSETGKAYDISELITTATWETFQTDQPGKFTFNYLDDSSISFKEGSQISFKYKGANVFYGYVFKRGLSNGTTRPVTAYDQLRYLKNKAFYYTENLTAAQIYDLVCKDFNLRHKITSVPAYVVAPYIHDNKSLFEICAYGIDQTLINTGGWFTIRDVFGTLEFVNINDLKSNLYIDDSSLLTDFNYQTSIDEDTYNQIKLSKENKETAKKDIYIVQDTNNIKKWGILQYFESVDENATEAQIKTRGDQLIKLKNRVQKSLSLECVGDLRASAGVGIVVSINALKKELDNSNPRYFMIQGASHTFQNDYHTMKLEMQVSV